MVKNAAQHFHTSEDVFRSCLTADLKHYREDYLQAFMITTLCKLYGFQPVSKSEQITGSYFGETMENLIRKIPTSFTFLLASDISSMAAKSLNEAVPVALFQLSSDDFWEYINRGMPLHAGSDELLLFAMIGLHTDHHPEDAQVMLQLFQDSPLVLSPPVESERETAGNMQHFETAVCKIQIEMQLSDSKVLKYLRDIGPGEEWTAGQRAFWDTVGVLVPKSESSRAKAMFARMQPWTTVFGWHPQVYAHWLGLSYAGVLSVMKDYAANHELPPPTTSLERFGRWLDQDAAPQPKPETPPESPRILAGSALIIFEGDEENILNGSDNGS
ncbi:hypothetical protein FB451DRAFT_1378517 [Mycena latifolia]|nr:hypothetical protein FB451DRAFT_1378517 [Mycena latifolia]